MSDLISRQAAIEALNGIINRFEQILRDIRESKVDDSVCGMCEYDGAFVGQSGDWCNECPGFEKDDCFRLSDECRKRWLESVELPAAQPEKRTNKRTGKWIPCSERLPEEYGEFLITMTEKAKAEDFGFDLDEIYVRKMRYNSNGWQLPRHIPSWINEAVKDEVLAWMPLPEPYQEEGEKDGKDT